MAIYVNKFAEQAGVDERYIKALCTKGRIKARMVTPEWGGQPHWEIEDGELEKFIKERSRREAIKQAVNEHAREDLIMKTLEYVEAVNEIINSIIEDYAIWK